MKMKYSTSLPLLLLLVISLTSCDKVIDLKLNNNTGQLIIEGNIINTTGAPQIIKLSTNVPFSATNTYPAVTGATVNVSDPSGNTFQFTEGPSGTYSSASFTGATGISYHMNVATVGKTYQASSIMPVQVNFDSLTYKDDDIGNTNHRKEVTVNYKDPAGLKNQYRFIVTVNSVQIKRVFDFNDDYTDGRDVHQTLPQNDRDILAGDTVKVEMQCIDNPMFIYWDTLHNQGEMGPGGSVTPSNPPTNITPEVLGYFSAHTTQSITVIIK